MADQPCAQRAGLETPAIGSGGGPTRSKVVNVRPGETPILVVKGTQVPTEVAAPTPVAQLTEGCRCGAASKVGGLARSPERDHRLIPQIGLGALMRQQKNAEESDVRN